MSKKLVAYFSASGVTARAAKTLAAAAGADLYEIKPEVPYTSQDLNWNDTNSRSSTEMKNPNARPAISGGIDAQAYDVIFIGFPIWWYREPSIIDTFLQSYDFSGKTLVPFATSGGSGLGKTEMRLRERCNGTGNWKPGKLLNGRLTAESMTAWIAQLGI